MRQSLKSVFLIWHVEPTLYDALIHQPRRQNHRIFRILNDLESFLWHLLTDCPLLHPTAASHTHPGHHDEGCNLHTWHCQWLGPHCFWRHPISFYIVQLFFTCYGNWPPRSSFCLLKQHRMNQFFFFFNFYWSQLLYNIALVAIMHTKVNQLYAHLPLFWISFPFRSPESWVEFLCCIQ